MSRSKKPTWDSLPKDEQERILDIADEMSTMRTGKSFAQTRQELAEQMETTARQVKDHEKMQGRSISDGLAEARAGEIRAAATTTAEQLVKDLLLKVFYQSIGTGGSSNYLRWIDELPVFTLEQGNSKEYVTKTLQGIAHYNSAQRIETTDVVNKQHAQVSNFFVKNSNGDLVLNTYSFQWKIWTNIKQPEWVPYFKQGTLEEYIAILLQNLRETRFLALSDFILSRITAETTLAINGATTAQNQQEGKIFKVAGTATNMYNVVVDDLLKIMNELELETSKYNYGGSTWNDVFPKFNKDDYIILVPDNFYTSVRSMLSQLPSAQLFPLENFISASQFKRCGYKLNVPGLTKATTSGSGTNTTITQTTVAGGVSDVITKDANNKYIPNDQIIIFPKWAIQRTRLVNLSNSQDFASNMSSDVFVHYWENIMFRKNAPFIVYQNANLLTQPGSPA